MDIKNTTSPNFGGFKKIVGTPSQIQKIRQGVPDKYLTLAVNKKPHKTALYLFSGKHFDKLIKVAKKNCNFFEIRHNVEKFMKETPKKLSFEKASKKLEKGKL